MWKGHVKHIGTIRRTIRCCRVICLYAAIVGLARWPAASSVQAAGEGPVQNLTQGGRYNSIGDAIQQANNGDVIVAAPGTYNETVTFDDKAVTLQSQDPNDFEMVAATIIAGIDEAVSFAYGQDANSVLAGFTLSGGVRGIYCSGAAPTVLNCRILGSGGPGIELTDASNATIVNCIIAENSGAGIDLSANGIGRNLILIDHCTIVGNRGSGIAGGSPSVTNSIVRDNAPGATGLQIAGDAPAVSYCNVQGDYPGEGNIDVDPGFVEPGYWIDLDTPEAAWVGGNYHLLGDSPCIDAGDPNFTMDVVATDVDGDARILGGRTDIGCDEVSQPVYVTWLGHASVKIAWKDLVIYVDPYRLTTSPQDADLILVTHSHSDHYSPSDIARVRNAQTQFVAAADVVHAYGSGLNFAPGQSLDVAGVHITGVAMYNLTKTNHPKANNWVGFIVDIGGKRIYLAGDTDLTPEMKALTDIDLAFLPAGGGGAMDAVEAAEATKYIQPTLAVPYHWGAIMGTLADAQQFATLAACNVKVMTAGQTISSDDWSKDFMLLSHWKLDEMQGIVASDSVGNHSGTLFGGVSWEPMSGRIGGAVALNGVDGYIETPFFFNPSNGSFSVFAWVQGGAPGQTILSQIGGVSWLLADTAAGALATKLAQSGRNSRNLISTTIVVDGEWHRVGLTWDGSVRTLYVDDVEVVHDTQAGIQGTSTGLRFGAGPNNEAGSFWCGWIDDIRIYSRAVVP